MKNTIEKAVLLILAVSILGYVYFTYYFQSEWQSISLLKRDIDNTKQTIKKLKNDQKTIDSKIELEKQQSTQLDDAIPDNYDKKVIIEYFYKLVKENGLTSEKITFAESLSKEFKTASVSLRVTGGYSDVNNFMTKVENDKRKFTIRQANISFDDKGEYGAALVIEHYALK